MGVQSKLILVFAAAASTVVTVFSQRLVPFRTNLTLNGALVFTFPIFPTVAVIVFRILAYTLCGIRISVTIRSGGSFITVILFVQVLFVSPDSLTALSGSATAVRL